MSCPWAGCSRTETSWPTSARTGREGDRVVAVLQFFHIYGLLVMMLAPLRYAGTVVTAPRFELAEFLCVIQDCRITRAFVVPPIVLALAKDALVDQFDPLEP
jgi:acyl-CoA synthetase (AMP-forming)/AMP-acid ligase II